MLNFRVDMRLPVRYVAGSGVIHTWREFEVPTLSRARREQGR